MILGRGVGCKGGGRWSCAAKVTVLMTLFLLLLQCSVICTCLEVITSLVDRDGDSLLIEDILEGFGSAPVSVEFSPVSPHMFMGFKAGAVRIYPEGADTNLAEQFHFCIDIEDQVYANNDLGLLNFLLHPDWPNTPYGYMLYVHDPGYEDDCLIEPYWCEKDERLVRIEVNYNEETGEVECGEQVLLLNEWCTGSNHHGGGGMVFMGTGDMVFAVGDLSSASQRDVGDDDYNSCLDPSIPLPQGNFRSQRSEFYEGKIIRITADALLKIPPNGTDPDVGVLEPEEDFTVEGRGFRNPFRMGISSKTGDIVVGDVGLDTAESLKVVPDLGSSAGSMGNYGWPCIEGDAWIAPYTNEWLIENESDICDSVRGTTQALPEMVDYEEVKVRALAGELDWVPPAFVYRRDTIDEEYPDFCATTIASVSAVYFYGGDDLPGRYKGRLFVGDYSKDCVFYFDVDEQSGAVDWSTPHVLFESRAIADFKTDPKTGILYAIDAKFHILIKIASTGVKARLETDVVDGPVPLEVTLNASESSSQDTIVSLQWDCEGDGEFEAESSWAIQSERTHVCTYASDGLFTPTVRLQSEANMTGSDSVTILAGEATKAPTPAPATGSIESPTFTQSPLVPPNGDLLSSPPELPWEYDSNSSVFYGKLEFGVVMVDNFWGTTTTRGYNGQVPGPTVRMEACSTYRLEVTNLLGIPNPGGTWNTLKDPNSTNIHTHGLHLSGESSADDVLHVEIMPGESHTYQYTIPCDHAGGTFWYHPHHHGSTALQLGGGAMGVLVVEDRTDVHGIPLQISNMSELVLAIQEISPSETIADSEASGDILYRTTALSRHYLVNGEVFPSIQLERGRWVRLRMAFAGHGNAHAISIEDPDGNCEMNVLAKDGVYLSSVPRLESKLFFTPASRVDVALRCSVAAEYELRIESSISLGETVQLATIDVVGTSSAFGALLETWEPCRPYYLEDLTAIDFDENKTVSLTVRETIGGEPYTGPDDILLNMTANEVQEWRIIGSDQHPFHMHVNHVQFVRVDGPSLVPGWHQAGDWVDTVQTDLAVVRFRTERYGGHVAMHCHVSTHSDTGVMAVANIIGGEGPNENPEALSPGSCGSHDMVGFGYNPNPDSTPAPNGSQPTEGTTSSSSSTSGTSTEGSSPEAKVPFQTPSPTLAPGSLSSGAAAGAASNSSDNTWWIAAAGGGIGGLLVVGMVVALMIRQSRHHEVQGKMHAASTSDKVDGETKQEPVANATAVE